MKIREYLLLVLLGILTFVLVGGVTFITTIQRKALDAGIDHELLTAATMVLNVLPEGYHENISNNASVSSAEFQHLTTRFNEICTNAHLEQIWSVMVLNGKTFYTSSTSPQIEGKILENPAFFENVNNPEIYTPAFVSMQPKFMNLNNQWGLSRAVIIPYRDSLGRQYAIGVSRSLSEINTEIQSTVDLSLLVVGIILLLSCGIGIFVVNRLVWPIEKLTQTAHRIAAGDLSQAVEKQGPKELQDLAQSIISMQESMKIRKTIEDALIFSENRYRLLFDEMSEGFALHEIITDDQGKPYDYRFLEINPAFEKLTGLKRVDLLGKRIMDVLPGTESYWIESYGEVALTGKPFTLENFSSSIDKWVEVRAYCPKHGQFAVTFSDISRRKKAEEQLQIAAKYPSQNPNPVLRISPAGQILYANSPSDLLLAHWKSHVNGWLPDDWKRRVAEIFSSKTQQEFDIDCGSIIYSCIFVPILEEDYVNVYGRDITERKHAEQEIIQLNTVLEQRVQDRTLQLELSNKELEAFAYSVSHDLRAPLRGIDGWSQALQEEYESFLDTKGVQYLNRVRGEANRMGQLIDDLLKLSKVTRFDLKRSQVNLSDLAQNISGRLNESEKYHTVTFIIEPDLFCIGDSQLLEIALTNLLDNASKFSGTRDNPKVEFGYAKSNGKSAYFIRDNGVGFDMAFSQKLFGAFQRLHAQTEFPGTGIGLATVQRIIHRHGGTIWADSQPDIGATFFFTIPELIDE